MEERRGSLLDRFARVAGRGREDDAPIALGVAVIVPIALFVGLVTAVALVIGLVLR